VAKSIDPVIIAEKNRLASGGAFILLLEITIPGAPPTVLRFAQAQSDVEWPIGGETYTRIGMLIGDMRESSRNNLPSLPIRISNVQRSLEAYVNDLRQRGVLVRMMLVHSEHLDLADPIDEWTFSINRITSDENYISFELGAPNPFLIRFPRDRYVPDFCRHRFRGIPCGFTGADITEEITFAEVAGPFYTLTRTGGGAWGVDDFFPPMIIRVSGSAENDGEYTVSAVSSNEMYVEEEVLAGTDANVTVDAICRKTLTNCRANGRSEYFGGSPGMSGGVYV
jgi:phage-related protein